MEETGLDQHFMIDRELIKRIIGYSDLKKEDVILEIGPGKGFLTKELIKKCKVIAVEKDEKFEEELSKLSKISKNLEIIFGNAINLIKSLKFNKVVSNIPYNISEPLLKQLFKKQPELVIVTVSESFAEKLLNQNSKIGLQASLFFNVEKLEDVQRKAFLPRPKTDSMVVKLVPREEKSLSTADMVLRKFVLLHDMKTKNALRESLVYGLELTKNKAREIIGSLNLEVEVLEKNSDLLSFEEFKKIKEALASKLSKLQE